MADVFEHPAPRRAPRAGRRNGTRRQRPELKAQRGASGDGPCPLEAPFWESRFWQLHPLWRFGRLGISFLPKVVSRHRRSRSRPCLLLAKPRARRWPQAAIHSSPMEEAIGARPELERLPEGEILRRSHDASSDCDVRDTGWGAMACGIDTRKSRRAVPGRDACGRERIE